MEELDFILHDFSKPVPADTIEDEAFDFIIDKATLDCCLSSREAVKKAKTFVDNAFRMLGKGGTYVCISYGPPETRERLFGDRDWRIQKGEIQVTGKKANANVYVMTKPL